MDQVLLGLPFTYCYMDDILISGSDEETHLRTLYVVLGRLEEYGLHVKQESVYLDHIIDAAEFHKSPEKERTTVAAAVPTYFSQLRSLHRMISYYGWFILTILKYHCCIREKNGSVK